MTCVDDILRYNPELKMANGNDETVKQVIPTYYCVLDQLDSIGNMQSTLSF
jgi:hypothetical protein